MSFGFLCAAIYLGPWWHRVIIFLSAIPLTIFMNSFRIGVIGALVNSYGTEQAEGFLHYFEGWVVFMFCVGILFLEMWILAKSRGARLMEVFALDIPSASTLTNLLPSGRVQPQLIASTVVLCLGVVLASGLQSRQDLIPERETFSTFPLIVDEWKGRDELIDDPGVLKNLAADDYFLAVYWNTVHGGSVGMWVAYYSDQRKGEAVHSPRACLPGGGWKLESFDDHVIKNLGPNGEDYVINRSVISQGDARQLVYYWFVERGRIQTNEYWVKWYIFWDSLTKGRSDGALVRVTTFVPDVAFMDEADQRLEEFVRAIQPKLAYFLPQQDATFEEAKAAL
jgi:exosortase D (VPLPA-CTERM-specific)